MGTPDLYFMYLLCIVFCGLDGNFISYDLFLYVTGHLNFICEKRCTHTFDFLNYLLRNVYSLSISSRNYNGSGFK